MAQYKLSDLFTLQMGKTPARAKDEYWNNGDNEWISIGDLSSFDKYTEKTKETISDKAVQESGIKIVPQDTVIMSFKLSLGKTCITTQPIYTNEAIMAFIPKLNNRITTDFLYYYLSSIDWNKSGNRAVMGTTLNKATLSNVVIDVPQIQIQNDISSKLDKLSVLISKRKQQLQKLDELVKARFVEMFGDLGKNSMGWERKSLEEICYGIGDGLHGTPKYTDTKGYPFINGNNLVNGKVVISPATKYVDEDTYRKYFIHINQNAILISINGTLGKIAFYDGEQIILGKSACYCNFKPNINRKFAYGVMTSDAFLNYLDDNSTKSTIKNVGLKAMRAYQMIIPPIELQNKFADFVEQTDKSKLSIRKSLDKLEVLKKALMQEYFG